MEEVALDHKLVRSYFRAVESGHPDDIKAFLDDGMPVNTVDRQTGATALHILAAHRARPAFRMVVGTGTVDYLIRDKKGRLASELAEIYGRDPAMARLLRNKEVAQARTQRIKLRRRERDEPKKPSIYLAYSNDS